MTKIKDLSFKLKQAYCVKEQREIGEKFIDIMEIIYAIVLACGVVKVVEVLDKGVPLKIWASILISVLVLVRFFFAPSKNVKAIGKKGVGWKWSIMPFDIPVLMAHSFIYYYMCYKISDIELFYRFFFILLMVNSFWLFFIWFRLRNEPIIYIKVWAVSNLIFCGLYLGTFKVGLDSWLPWFFLAFLNTCIDLGVTYSDYFQD